MKKQNIHLLRNTAEELTRGAKNSKDLAQIVHDLDQVRTAFDSNSKLVANLSDKAIAQEKREGALCTALEGCIRNDVLAALIHLLRNDALKDLGGLSIYVERKALECGDLSIADLKTAEELEETDYTQITEMIQKQLQKEIILKKSIDPKLLGGFTLQIEEKTIDASMRGTLQRLKETLTK